MRFKQILSAAMLCSISVLAYAGAAFTDTTGIPEQADIDYAVSRGLFNGTDETHFSPGEPLTRAQAVAVLARQARVQGLPADTFADVPDTSYYSNALGWACESGIIQGTSATTFEPDRPVTHAELAAILTRYQTWLGREDPTFETSGSGAVTRAQAAAYFTALDHALLDRDTTLLTHNAADGVTLTGKLDLPAGEVRRLVVFINGSGPNTYDNTRQLDENTTYNYFDLFAERLTAGGTAFFRWSTRGCTPGGEPPLYTDIDEAAYQTYVPENSIRDAETVVRALR